MALQDQCTPDEGEEFAPERLPAMVPLPIFEYLLPRLSGIEFKVVAYLVYTASLTGYAEPGWRPALAIATGIGERPAVVTRAVHLLVKANVVRSQDSDRSTLYALNAATRARPERSVERPERAVRTTVPSRDAGVLRRLAARYGYRCLACGATNALLEADHIIPRSKGGPDALPNRQLLCGPCNRTKRTQTIDYRPHQDEDGA